MRRGFAAGLAIMALGAVAGPLASSASALTPTKLVAHSIIADVKTDNIQARVPIRPSANLYDKQTGVPLANQVVQFFAGSKGLCAVRTNTEGYAECPGPIRILFSTLALGHYRANYPGTSTYEKSSDIGQILTIGGTAILP